MNCPGRQAGGPVLLAETSSSVRVSAFSFRFVRTRKGVVSIGSTRVAAIEIQELNARSLKALHEGLRETFHKIVPHRGVTFAFAPQALAVEADRADLIYRSRVECPAIWRKKPRPTKDVAGLQSLKYKRPALAGVEFNR